MNRLMLTKRGLLGAALICTILIAGFTIYSQGQVEATFLEPHPGLVGWWRFDEGTSTTAADSSEQNNDGTVYGSTWTTGKYGQALNFDGVNDYVGVASFPSLTGSTVSVEAWINLQSQVMQWPDVVEILENWSSIGGIKIQVTNYTKLRFRIRNGVTGKEASTPQWTIETGWHHLVGTYDGQYARFYVDGALFGNSSLVTNALNLGSPHLYVGRGFNTDYVKGIIDEVRVYNRVLSTAEIQGIFQSGMAFFPKLTAKVPEGTTQVMVTLSWQGIGTINVTMTSPSSTYTEDNSSVYLKTTYSTSNGVNSMLNIKRISVSVSALSSYENWDITLASENVEDYNITVEIQK